MNETELSALLDITASRIARRTKAGRARAELTPARMSVLSVLIQHGSKSVSELAGIESVRLPTMTNLINGLERSAYIVRRVDKVDKRVRLIQVTKKGRTAWRSQFHKRDSSLAGVVSALTKTERKTIQRAAAILRDKLIINA